MTSQSVPAPSLPPWAEPLTASLSAEPQFHERQVLYFPGSPEFADSENDYFNGAVREAQSVAVVRPTSTADVSALLRILRRHLPTTTPIAVRGAGHATYVGTAKASGGVTIDLRGLRGIDVLAGDRHVRIAAGEKWHSVLAALESHKPPLTTVGGRSPNIDAIGFLLGAGLSGLSAGFGFSADMVTSWEVVLASGEIHYREARRQQDGGPLGRATRQIDQLRYRYGGRDVVLPPSSAVSRLYSFLPAFIPTRDPEGPV